MSSWQSVAIQLLVASWAMWIEGKTISNLVTNTTSESNFNLESEPNITKSNEQSVDSRITTIVGTWIIILSISCILVTCNYCCKKFYNQQHIQQRAFIVRNLYATSEHMNDHTSADQIEMQRIPLRTLPMYEDSPPAYDEVASGPPTYDEVMRGKDAARPNTTC